AGLTPETTTAALSRGRRQGEEWFLPLCADYFFLPPLHLPKPVTGIFFGAEMYSPAVLPSTGSPLTTNQTVVFGWPLRWQGALSNPNVCWIVLLLLTPCPFGSDADWVWRSTTPHPNPWPGNVPEH